MLISPVGDCVGPDVVSPTYSESIDGTDVLVMGVCVGVDVGGEVSPRCAGS